MLFEGTRRRSCVYIGFVEGTRGPMRVYIRFCGLLGLLWGLLERIVEGTRGPIRVYFRFRMALTRHWAATQRCFSVILE